MHSLTERGGRPARALHPGAWWAWSLALATAATRTSNPIVLLLLVAVAAFTVSARRSPHSSRSFALFLRLGVVVLVVRVVFDIVFGAQPTGDVLLRVPTVPLPGWAAGLHLGGNITVQGMLTAVYGGLQLATLLVCVGSANALASPRRLLRAMPGALYEAGVAITVAVSFAPQLATAAVRVRRARRLRGRPSSGVRSWLGIALPVLEDALERSIELAAAMDSRGFGRRGTASPVRRRLVSSAVVAGLVAVGVAIYELLDAASPTLIGLPLLVVGTATACGAVLFGGRHPTRTKYRPDSWQAPEWIVVASGVAALVGVLIAGRLYPGSLHTTTYPLVVPQLPWPALLGLALALVPAWVTSPQTAALHGLSPAPGVGR
jgi:energy-coupling factor transport system permease protein